MIKCFQEVSGKYIEKISVEKHFPKKLAICTRRQTAPGGSHDFQLLYG